MCNINSIYFYQIMAIEKVQAVLAEGKKYIDVDKTVQAIKEKLQAH